MREIKDLIENLKGKTPEEKAFSAKKEVLKYGVRIESETLDDFSRAFVHEKFGGRADEKINCLTEDSHIHVSTKSEVKAILDAYVWIIINKKDSCGSRSRWAGTSTGRAYASPNVRSTFLRR